MAKKPKRNKFISMDAQKCLEESSENKKETINFRCSNCSQTVKLKEIRSNLSNSTNNVREGDEGRLCSNDQHNVDADIDRKMLIPINLPEIGDDFLVVEEIVDFDKVRVAEALLSIVSSPGNSDVDHSMCDVCANNLLELMDHQLTIKEKDCKEYLDFIGHMELEDSSDLDDLQAELEVLLAEERTLEEDLNKVEADTRKMDKVLLACKNQEETIEKMNHDCHLQYVQLKRQLLTLDDQQMSLNNQRRHTSAHLTKLKSLNVFDICFYISDTGPCGTINNFRLGRLPDCHVGWQEINAAWGQVAFLTHCLAKRLNVIFRKYRIVPYGNHSYIQFFEAKDLPLYFSGKDKKFICDAKFDSAMVAYLECLQQLHEKMERLAKFHLPHPLQKGRISEGKTGKTFSIRVQFNTEECWTKALKLVLTNLKWALACISTQFHDK